MGYLKMKFHSKLLSKIYGIYIIIVFLVCSIFSLVGAFVLPTLKLRRIWVRKMANSVFFLSRIKLEIEGLNNIPNEHTIIVANHASYIDGIILHAVLPVKFTFVIKSEMKNVPLANFLFKRVGSRYVERFKPKGTYRDARKLIKAGAEGESLAIFPEGTFTEKKGLDKFRTGAFLTAIKSNMPIVPLVIQGSREILPANKYLPVKGVLKIKVLKSINTKDGTKMSSKELKDIVRKKILDTLDEPDLLVK